MTSFLNNFEDDPVVEAPGELFEQIGLRLVLLQELECFIAFVLKVIFPKDTLKAKEAILKADNETMGQLLSLLRKRVTIKDDFDEMLKRVLISRNMFVHDLSNKFNLRSKDGQDNVLKYLLDTLDDLTEVSQMMKAAILFFADKKGIDYSDIEDEWRTKGDLNHLESNNIPKVPEVFKKNN